MLSIKTFHHVGPILIFFNFISIPRVTRRLSNLKVLQLIRRLNKYTILNSSTIARRCSTINHFINRTRFIHNRRSYNTLNLWLNGRIRRFTSRRQVGDKYSLIGRRRFQINRRYTHGHRTLLLTTERLVKMNANFVTRTSTFGRFRDTNFNTVLTPIIGLSYNGNRIPRRQRIKRRIRLLRRRTSAYTGLILINAQINSVNVTRPGLTIVSLFGRISTFRRYKFT